MNKPKLFSKVIKEIIEARERVANGEIYNEEESKEILGI